MPAIARIGDLSFGEQVGCFLPPTAIVNGSPNVLIEGRAAATVGSTLFPHFCFRGNQLVSHTNRTISTGSPTVFINGKAAATIGSTIIATASPGDTPCTDTVAAGAATVTCAL